MLYIIIMIQYIYELELVNKDGEIKRILTKDSSELINNLNRFCINNDILKMYNIRKIRNLLYVDKKTQKNRYKKPPHLLAIKKTVLCEYYKDDYINKYDIEDYNKRITTATGRETRTERIIKFFYKPIILI